METIRFRLVLILIVAMAVMTFTGCGIRYMVSGTVIDMDTHQPVAGAVVSIKWEKENFSLPGMGRSFTFLELADAITGPDGKFKIPKYTFRDYHLAAYKKGYVCWASDDIFPDYRKREGFEVENGMVIELEPFKESYSKNKHAYWVKKVLEYNTNWSSGYKSKLREATKEELKLYEKNKTEGK